MLVKLQLLFRFGYFRLSLELKKNNHLKPFTEIDKHGNREAKVEGHREFIERHKE